MTSAATLTLPALTHVSDDDLTAMIDAVADNDAALSHVLAELDRRDQEQAPTVPVQRVEGEPTVTADDERRAWLNAQREIRPDGKRETIVQCVDRLYGEMVDERLQKAEDECRGHLLTQAGFNAGIDPRTLFYGNASRAVKWASDELLAWFEENGRPSWAEYMLEWTGHTRYADDAAKARGQWVEYLRKGRDRRRGDAAKVAGRTVIQKFGAR